MTERNICTSTNSCGVSRNRIPLGIWCIIALLSAFEPITHLWISFFPPKGTVPTGLHIPDTGIFLLAMNMFDSGFHSPYATHAAVHGSQYLGYYAQPFYWLYGIGGFLGNRLHITPFLWLGFINGVGAFLFLITIYRFLQTTFPRYANRSFVLYTLGGGLGGVAYVVANLAGWTTSPSFELYFRRFAMYELIEGPSLFPVLLMPRLYYTIPLAFCFGSLTAFVRALQLRCSRHMAFSVALLFVGSFFNQRFGPPTWFIGCLYILQRQDMNLGLKVRYAVQNGLSVFLGCFAAFAVMRMSPRFFENALAGVQQHMWLTPFVTAGFFHVCILLYVIRGSYRHLPPPFQRVVTATSVYLLTFSALFLLYQIYYGNLLIARDAAVAVSVSDPALLGFLAGTILVAPRRQVTREPSEEGWVLVWALVFLSVAVSAWGRGRFLQFTPQRLMIFLGPSLAILSAIGLTRLASSYNRVAMFLQGIILTCGITSLLVGAICFQGPLCYGSSSFRTIRCQVMSEEDAYVLEKIPSGRVLTTKRFSDVIALREGMSVLGGMGAIDLSDQPWTVLGPQLDRFFSDSSDADFRREFVRQWQVDYVFCPASDPIPEPVYEELQELECLELVAQEGNATLFRVQNDYLQ
ncbi:MAG TPA: hypothetical protein PKY35_03755 [Candidatus Hydrogenedentes bacterium]|nr:hypothetical protein [Candidatus Hydrogenedentota bacterium]HOL76119.1 hypothetical protein [Candidatus Hydrogenedentota bacterium]HPO84733.1 hypothetical protein [Candidatus Hydrogenedentota bacterium]